MDEPASIATQTPQASAPPTIPGPIRRPTTGPVWHVPIGSVTIIVAVVGIATSLIAISSLFIDTGANPSMFDDVGAVLGVLTHIALLTGAIALLCRQRWSVAMLVIAGIARVLLGVAGPFKMLWVPDLFNQLIGLVWLAWVAAGPVFLCIWFARPRIRAQVRTWPRTAHPG